MEEEENGVWKSVEKWTLEAEQHFYPSDFFYGKWIRNLFCQNSKTLQEKCSEKLHVNNMTFVARLSAQYELDTKKKRQLIAVF